MGPKNPRLEKKKREKAKKDAEAAKSANSSTNSLSKLIGDGEELSGEDRLRARGIIITFEESSRKQHAHDRDIHVDAVTMTYHGSPLIEESDLSLNYGNRYGFIGRNGCGKSTFMEALGARCVPIPEGIDLYYVKEEIEASETSALDAVMSVEAEREKLEKEAEVLNDLIIEDDGNEELHDHLAAVYERLEQMDAATAETRASTILSGLGFTPHKQKQPTSSFSGGWRMRIALARALFIQPTLLLLDEPTNHLDMEAVVWLEDYLSKWDKILLMVSHSQDFMNNVCTHIVHLSQKKLDYFSGNYDSFVNTLREKQEEQEKRYKSEQDQINHMKEYVARFGQGNAKMAKQAQSKEKTLEKMVRGGLTDKVYKEKALDFKFNDCGKLSPPVLQCTDISFGYPGCEILYSGVDFGVDLDSRVALVGPNGAGKSTLLKLMTGDLMPVHGDVRPHSHLRISKFTQHFVDVLELDMCPLDYMLKLWPAMTREDGRKFLGRYGITGGVQTQVMEELSDGQKSRVVMAKIAKENPHVLFLDEPTNHLDMESIDSLARAINQFEGGMVLVSHDMRLISQVAKEIWMVSDKTIRKFVGEINDFKMYLRQQMMKSKLIEGSSADKAHSVKKIGDMFVPLAPLKTYGEAAPELKVAPKIAPPVPPTNKQESGEDAEIKKARLELAELAIKRQRERQAAAKAEKAAGAAIGATDAMGNDIEVSEPMEDEIDKLAAKEAKKAQRKAEKEAKEKWDREQEDIIKRRKAEKEAELQAAKDEAARKREEYDAWKRQKAERDAAKEAAEQAERERVEKILAEKRAEREARRAARQKRRAEEEAARQAAAEEKARNDPWTQDQQESFEKACLEFTVAYEKAERWTSIASQVGGKSRNQCMARYKFLKDLIRQRKRAESEAAAD